MSSHRMANRAERKAARVSRCTNGTGLRAQRDSFPRSERGARGEHARFARYGTPRLNEGPGGRDSAPSQDQ